MIKNDPRWSVHRTYVILLIEEGDVGTILLTKKCKKT